MKEPKPVYRASDGSDHPTVEAATRRNNLIEKIRTFEHAAHSLQRAVAENAKTADGEWFQFGYCDYWYITDRYGQMPRCVKVNVYQWSAKIEMERHDENAMLVVRFQDVDNSYTIPVSRLYAHELDAKLAHIAACEKYLKEVVEEVERIKTGKRS